MSIAAVVLIFVSVIALLCVITPIFANAGAFLLSAYSSATLKPTTTPTSIVILGGGLTEKNGEIVLNPYSKSRADGLILHSQNTPTKLPIITSGVESPWLNDYLKSALPHAAIINENASMNTCENAIFTAKLMAYHELAPSVYLVTDRYHMARARRQFARAGIDTAPLPAPIAAKQSWFGFNDNLKHSRRAAYEIAALARDILRPQNNCRSSDEISIEQIATPRRTPKLF